MDGIKDDLTDFIESTKKKDNLENLKRQNKSLLKELEKKNLVIEAYEQRPRKLSPIKEDKTIKKGQGTVLTLLSDIHPDNLITLESTNGINQNAPEISAIRIENYFTNLLKLVRNNRQDIILDNLLIGMLGDLIHGFIHEEYLRTNTMTPPEATIFIIEQLTKGFNYILKYGLFKDITCICKIGNHSRTTDKVYSQEEARLSYEWVIYHTLAKQFPQIKFSIDNAYFTYFQVYDKTIRFHHGHNIKYNGGVGGIYVPLMRYRLKVNQQKKADLDCMGHWHTSDWLRNANTLLNGSICGIDAWALGKGFEPEPPMQQFLIISAEKGFTVNTPIIL